MVRKLVSVPPSQRLVTKYMPARRASSCTMSCAWRLVPTNSTWPPRPTVVDDEVERALEEARRLVEVDDVDAVARAVDERPHLRVPALGLVAEVDAGFEQLAHARGVALGSRSCRSISAFGANSGEGSGISASVMPLVDSFISRCSFRLFLRPAAGKPATEVASTEPDGRAPGRVMYSPRTSPQGAGNLRQNARLVKGAHFQFGWNRSHGRDAPPKQELEPGTRQPRRDGVQVLRSPSKRGCRRRGPGRRGRPGRSNQACAGSRRLG